MISRISVSSTPEPLPSTGPTNEFTLLSSVALIVTSAPLLMTPTVG